MWGKNKKIQSTVVEFEDLNARYISKDGSANLSEDAIYVSMKPYAVEQSPPVCLICVVDISGSMGLNCASNVENMESLYISRLSLVKHSIKTIVSTLRKDDMISVIAFDDSAKMIVKPKITENKAVKDKIIEKIDGINECGCTNMWDGIKVGIETSSSISYDKYQKSIMVFTDGESNINPNEGVYQALKNTLNACDDQFTISTFSFGNNVKPDLLSDIAKLGNGIYGYCPDGTMVGTIFINYMANILSTITPVIKVTVTQNDLIKDTKVIGPLYRGVYRDVLFTNIDKNSLENTKITLELPMTKQTFNVPLNTEPVDLLQFINEEKEKQKESNNDTNDTNKEEEEEELLDETSDSEETAVALEDIDTNIIIDEKEDTNIPIQKYEERLMNQVVRNTFITTLLKILDMDYAGRRDVNDPKASMILNEYYEGLNGLAYRNDFIKGLLIDIKSPDPNHGQVEKALDPKYYRSWGKCYLSSFLRFQEFEQCGNFKDQSLQCYAHKVFNTYREMANTIFTKLPPLKKIFLENCETVGRIGPNANANANVNMRSFINPNGGCFNGDALVLLEDGTSKRVRDLKKGDCLCNHATVQCLIEQKIFGFKPSMCNIDGVLLTPYHPVCKEGQWYFPIDLVQPQPMVIDAWFNLILEDESNKKYEVEFENGVKAITLGHYRKENKVLEHPYFGTDLVLKDLQERDPSGYDNGYIYIEEFNGRQLQYDKNNQYCMNYYKVPSSNTTITYDNTIIIMNQAELVK